jgi:ATP-binding cassette subfamily B protein
MACSSPWLRSFRTTPCPARTSIIPNWSIARRAGLKAKAIRLDWDGLTHLGSALPAIVRLKSGASLVLVSVNNENQQAPLSVTLRDPNAAADALLQVDWLQFQDAWTGDALLARRSYDLED